MTDLSYLVNVLTLACIGYLVLTFGSKDERKATRLIARTLGMVSLIVAMVVIVNWGFSMWSGYTPMPPRPAMLMP
jgi:hypothetical protein